MRKGERGFFYGCETDGKSFQTTESEIAIVGRNSAAEEFMSDAEKLVVGVVVHSNGTEEKIAVSADVFG